MIEYLIVEIGKYGFSPLVSNILAHVVGVVACIIIYFISFIIIRLIENRLITNFVKNSKTQIDDVLLETNTIKYMTYLLPLILNVAIISNLFSGTFRDVICKILYVLIDINIVAFGIALLNAVDILSLEWEISKSIPIKSITQVLKVTILLVFGIVIFSELTGSAKGILTGLSAMFAALAFVFKDFIMGFVSSIYLSANKVLNMGDWIAIPADNVDGEIIEITMQSVKVLNWDKSLSIVPTYNLILKSYKNWKTMSGLNARRMQVSFNIDMDSIKNIDQPFVEDVRKRVHYPNYIEDIQPVREDGENAYNTNLMLFKKYVERYIAGHKGLTKNLTLMSRLLNPSELGLPYEIYCFTDGSDWKFFEGIKSEITMFIVNECKIFGIKIYQKSSSSSASAVNSSLNFLVEKEKASDNSDTEETRDEDRKK